MRLWSVTARAVIVAVRLDPFQDAFITMTLRIYDELANCHDPVTCHG
jgi:hypothetical protein